MSVVVRTEGNELQVGVPQAVVETDDSFSGIWDWDVEPDGKRFVLIRDEESGGPAWSNPAEVHCPLVRGTQAPRSQEIIRGR